MKLFSVSRNGNPAGVAYAKNGVEALRTVQRTAGLPQHGGWLAEVIHAAPYVEPKPQEWKTNGVMQYRL